MTTIAERVTQILNENGPTIYNHLIQELEPEDAEMKLIIGSRIDQLIDQGELLIEDTGVTADPHALVTLPQQQT